MSFYFRCQIGLSILCFIFLQSLKAQHTDFVVRTNASVGGEYHKFDFNGTDHYFSPGGGVGLGLGVQHEFKSGFSLLASLGFQLAFIYHYENINGFTNKTSASFNRLIFDIGAQYLFDFKNEYFKGFAIGGGVSGHKPSKLKRTENDFEYEPISYDFGVGFHTDAKFRVRIAQKYFLEPGIRYRNLGFTYQNNSRIQNLIPEEFKKLNVNGVEFYLSFFKRSI